MHMNDHNQFMVTWLEEEMLDVAKENVHMLIAERRQIPETILVDFDFARDALSIQRWAKVDIRELHRPTV
jgi:hypothetical protein